ncbi:hypothetical protein ABZV77_26180 [Streptomyces sp. NPDC004732]|uniref:hypothetical protein n=1 Tax=Streptomyces sp. NPDC004732 TaxID=3154290 RepID=UPI00339F2F92
MSANTGTQFSGRGMFEFDVPKHLAGGKFVVEARCRMLGPGFEIHGETHEDGVTKHQHIGFVHWGATIHLMIPEQYGRLVVKGASSDRKTGRWSLECKSFSELPEFSPENSASASRMFLVRGGARSADVEFAGPGSVRHFDLEGGKEQELVSNTGSFRGTVTVPGEGVVAISPPFGEWGPMQKWKLTLRGR